MVPQDGTYCAPRTACTAPAVAPSLTSSAMGHLPLHPCHPNLPPLPGYSRSSPRIFPLPRIVLSRHGDLSMAATQVTPPLANRQRMITVAVCFVPWLARHHPEPFMCTCGGTCYSPGTHPFPIDKRGIHSKRLTEVTQLPSPKASIETHLVLANLDQ